MEFIQSQFLLLSRVLETIFISMICFQSPCLLQSFSVYFIWNKVIWVHSDREVFSCYKVSKSVCKHQGFYRCQSRGLNRQSIKDGISLRERSSRFPRVPLRRTTAVTSGYGSMRAAEPEPTRSYRKYYIPYWY